jgi:hypothetical protein
MLKRSSTIQIKKLSFSSNSNEASGMNIQIASNIPHYCLKRHLITHCTITSHIVALTAVATIYVRENTQYIP